jgi:ribosomal protein S18 acetylase RimI-like enzyme
MRQALRVAPLSPRHRDRVAAILRASGVFAAEEVSVALELFDEAHPGGRGPGLGVSEDGHRRLAPRAPHSDPSPPPSPSSDYLFLGAFTPEDELAGYACYGPTPGTDRTFDLYWIAVDPRLRGAGIGTTLLNEVERRLEGQHARMLVVETSSRSDYAPTRGFYGRRGYTETARVRGFYAPGDDRIILTKRFHHSPGGRGA